MKLIGVLHAGLLVVLWPGAILAEELPKSPVCWPLHFAGVTASVNVEAEVQRLLGPGILRDRDGDRSRHYVDSTHTATLSFDFSDSLVEQITVQEGIGADLKPGDLKRATSKWFDPKERFGNWGALHLGSSRDEVAENLGMPQEKPEPGQWRYQSKCTCELPEYFTVYFKGDRVTKIVFSAPSG